MPTPSRREGLYFCTQILLTILLFTMGSLVPVLGFWGTLFCPLPLALLGCRFGGRWFAAGVGMTVLLMWPLYPVSVVLYYIFGRAPVSAALYLVSELNARKLAKTCGEGLVISVISALAAQLALLLVFYLMTGQNILLPDVSQIENMIRQFELNFSETDSSQADALVQQMNLLIPRMLPSMVMIYAGFDAVLNYKFCSRFQLKSKSKSTAQSEDAAPSPRTLVPPPPFTDWRFPRSLLPALCSAFVLGMIANWQNWFETAMFAVNLKVVLNILFFMQGLSLAWWWMLRKNFGLVLRGVAVALMLFPLMWLWVVSLGVIDMMLNLRVRRPVKIIK